MNRRFKIFFLVSVYQLLLASCGIGQLLHEPIGSEQGISLYVENFQQEHAKQDSTQNKNLEVENEVEYSEKFLLTKNNANITSDSIINLISTELEPLVPNPASTYAKLFYSVKSETNVKIKIYDMFYKEVYSLVDEKKAKGRYELYIKIEQPITSGFYLLMMQTDEGLFTQRIVILK